MMIVLYFLSLSLSLTLSLSLSNTHTHIHRYYERAVNTFQSVRNDPTKDFNTQMYGYDIVLL